MVKILNTQIVTDGLEFDTLLLNGRIINRITNNTIDIYSSTHTFTGHGAVLWKGLFFQAMDIMFADTLDHLNSLVHPATHSASIITETATRVFATPEEEDKLNTIADFANLYVHPNTHTLGEVTDSATRLRMTIYERDKIVHGEENANNYSHPLTHEMTDFNGLLDGDGYIDAPLRTYFYNNFRHGLMTPINILFNNTTIEINNCYGIDSTHYTGIGYNTVIPLGFDNSFTTEATDKNGIYILGWNEGTNKRIGVIDTFSSHPGALRMKKNNGVIAASTLLSMSSTEVSVVSDDTEALKLNTADTLYRAIGFKSTSTESLTTVEDDVAWHTQRARKFHLENSYRTVNSSSTERLYYYQQDDLRYVLYSGGYDYLYRAVNNESVGSIRRLKTLSRRTLMYWSDTEPSNGYYTNIHIQWSKYSDNQHYFAVNVKRYTPNIQDAAFYQCGSEMSFMHHSYEEQRQVFVTPYITVTNSTGNNYAYCDEYLIVFETIDPIDMMTTWITIYRLNIPNRTITLHQTITLGGSASAPPMDVYYHCAYSSFYNSFLYTNYIVYWRSGRLYFLHRPITGGQFVAATDILSSTAWCTSGNSNVSYLTFSEREILLIGQVSYIHLLKLTTTYSNGSTHLSLGLTRVFDSCRTYSGDGWIGNSFKFTNSSVTRLKHHPTGSGGFYIYPAVSIQHSSVNLQNWDVTIWTPRIGIQQTLSVPRNSTYRPNVGYYYNPTTSLHEIYLSAGTWIHKYVWRPMQMTRNSIIGFASIETVCRSYGIGDFPAPIWGYYPMLLFSWRVDREFAEPVVYLSDGKRYALDSTNTYAGSYTDSIHYNFYRHDLAVSTEYLRFQNFNGFLDFDATVFDPGAEYVYFGFFGVSNLSVRDVATDTNLLCPGYGDKTRCFVLNPGQTVELPFKPNIIMFRYFTERDTFNVTSIDIGFDKYMTFMNGSDLLTDRPVVVNGRQMSISNLAHSVFVMAIAADSYEQPGSLIIDASSTTPLIATLKNGFGLPYIGGDVKSVGESDIVRVKTADTEIGLPDGMPGGFNGVRFIGMNLLGNINWNGEDNVEWDFPDDLPMNARDVYSHIPLAQVLFTNGGINRVVPYATRDMYNIPWFTLNIGETRTFANNFFTENIFITGHINDGESTYLINDLFINSDEIYIPNGVVITFNYEQIQVSTVSGQTTITPGHTSAQIRLTIQRLF